MKLKLLFFASIFICFSYCFSLEITHLEFKNISFNDESRNLNFQIENHLLYDYKHLQVNLIVNDSLIESKSIDFIASKQKIFSSSFFLDKTIKINKDKIRLSLFRVKYPNVIYDIWEALVIQKQVNEVGGESYVDAPWRMRKTDANGNVNPIPLHFYIHDSQDVPGGYLQPNNIRIMIRNASGSSPWQELRFNNDPAFFSYFSNESPGNPERSINEFNSNLNAEPSSSTSINFKGDESSFSLSTYVELDREHFYFTFTIPGSYFSGYEDVIDVQCVFEYTDLTVTDDEVCVRIFRSDYDMPKLQDWYRGDTHLHSFYTQNDAEIGFPLSMTKNAAKHIGLDWITTTDHTSDFDNYGNTGSSSLTGQSLLNSNWQDLQNEISTLNNLDSTMIYIPGQEVATANSKSLLVHFLAYPNPSAPFSLPFLGDGYGDAVLNPTASTTNTSVTIDDALNSVVQNNGFAYAAHPFASSDALPDGFPVYGGIWSLSNNIFPSNGSNFPETVSSFASENLIKCNDLSISSDVLIDNSNKLIKDGLKGAQIWNIRNSLITDGVAGGSDDEDDPWDAIDDGGDFVKIEQDHPNHHILRFRQGQEIVNAVNKLGLQKKNVNVSLSNWKMYYSAGTDAHGSFNYTNTDDVFLGAFTSYDVHDNAVGKLSTLTYCPNGMGTNGQNILSALKNGNTTISDGPIVVIGISNTGNNNINNTLMGEDVVLDVFNSQNNYLNISYSTNTEFGDMANFKLIIGTQSGEFEKNMTFSNNTGTNVLSYKLSDLFDSLGVLGGIQQNQYMYIRAEIETTINYNSINIYKKPQDQFHSFSNPIWFKYEALTAGVVDEFNDVKVYPNPTAESLIIETIDFTGAEVYIYDLKGDLVLKTKLENYKTIIDVSILEQSFYSVKIISNNKTYLSNFTKI
tara:strand:+ start:674 stop:3400 length:2727 start_codon:yes stop_codon:yes gene_type:complete